MSIGFGTRARIGHLYPSGGICDYEIQQMAPDGVQFLTTRVPFARTGVEDDLGFAAALTEHCDLLADARVDLIAVNCTAATMLAGPDNVRRDVRQRTGIDAVTTIEGVLGALDAFDARRVALLTPYTEEVVDAEAAYLAARGHPVVQRLGRPCATPVEQGEIPPDYWVECAGRVRCADVVLISCAGVQVADVIERIEGRVGVPVVTSNQALLWHTLRTLGMATAIPGYGALLSADGP